METEYLKHTFVCFMDILGFKDLVENNDPKQLEKIYKILLQKPVDHTTKIWEKRGVKDLTFGAELNSLVISDSIVIWTSNPSPIAFVKMMISVHAILFQTMNSGIPLRGAISAGQLTILKSENNTTVFGKGLVNAYKLESLQDWSGCIVDDEIIEAYRYMMEGLKSKERQLRIEDIHFLVQYPAPLKSGKIESRWVIDWTKLMNPTKGNDFEGLYITEKGVLSAFKSHKKNIDDWRIHSIIRNTFDFWHNMMNIENAEFNEFKNKEDAKKFLEKLKNNNA